MIRNALLMVLLLVLVVLAGCAGPYRGNSADAARKLCPGIIAELLPPKYDTRGMLWAMPDSGILCSGSAVDSRSARVLSMVGVSDAGHCGEAYDPVSDALYALDNPVDGAATLRVCSRATGKTKSIPLSAFKDPEGILSKSHFSYAINAWSGKLLLLGWGEGVVMLDSNEMTVSAAEVFADSECAWRRQFVTSGPWTVVGTRWVWDAVDISGKTPRAFRLDLDGDMPRWVAVDGMHGRFAFKSLADCVKLYYLEETGPRLAAKAPYPVLPGLVPLVHWFDGEGELFVEFVSSDDQPASAPAYYHVTADGKFEPLSRAEALRHITESSLGALDCRWSLPSAEVALEARKSGKATPSAWLFGDAEGIPRRRMVVVLQNGLLAACEPFALTLFDPATGKVLDAVAPENGFFESCCETLDGRLWASIARDGEICSSRKYGISHRRLHLDTVVAEEPTDLDPNASWSTQFSRLDRDALHAYGLGMTIEVARGNLATASKDGHTYVANEITHSMREILLPAREGVPHPLTDDLVLFYDVESDRQYIVSATGQSAEVPDADLDACQTGVFSLTFPGSSEALSLDLETGILYRASLSARFASDYCGRKFFLRGGRMILEDWLTGAAYLVKMTPCEPDARTEALVKFVRDVRGKK